MFSHLPIALTLMALCVTIHAAGVTWALQRLRSVPRVALRFWTSTRLFVIVSTWIVLLHLAEISLWAGFYVWRNAMPDRAKSFERLNAALFKHLKMPMQIQIPRLQIQQQIRGHLPGRMIRYRTRAIGLDDFGSGARDQIVFAQRNVAGFGPPSQRKNRVVLQDHQLRDFLVVVFEFSAMNAL